MLRGEHIMRKIYFSIPSRSFLTSIIAGEKYKRTFSGNSFNEHLVFNSDKSNNRTGFKKRFIFFIILLLLITINLFSHEISMAFQFCNLKKPQGKRNLLQVYCPKF